MKKNENENISLNDMQKIGYYTAKKKKNIDLFLGMLITITCYVLWFFIIPKFILLGPYIIFACIILLIIFFSKSKRKYVKKGAVILFTLSAGLVVIFRIILFIYMLITKTSIVG